MTALWKVLKLVDGVLVIHAGLACFNEEQIGGRRERNVDGSMIGRVVCHHLYCKKYFRYLYKSNAMCIIADISNASVNR